MASWIDFATAAPDLAAAGLDRFDRTGLVLVGRSAETAIHASVRWSRSYLGGTLYLGMMFRSTKALDLGREPRCLVHTTVTNKDGTDGEFNVYGGARPVEDPGERDRYGAALFEKIGWRPGGDFDLFAIDIHQVALVSFGDGKQVIKVWRPGAEVREVVNSA